MVFDLGFRVLTGLIIRRPGPVLQGFVYDSEDGFKVWVSWRSYSTLALIWNPTWHHPQQDNARYGAPFWVACRVGSRQVSRVQESRLRTPKWSSK